MAADEGTLNIDDAVDYLNDEGSNSDLDDAGDAIQDDTEVDDPLNGNAKVGYTQGEEADEQADENQESNSGTKEEGKKDDEEGEQKDDPELAEIPHYQQIKAKYPTIFKEFPGLKTAYFFGRDVQNLFGTVEQAKQAVGALEAYQELDQRIFQGDSEYLLTELHRQNSAEKFVDEFLPTLLKVNKDSYIRATEPVIVNVIKRMIAEGNQRGDKNIVNAARVFSREIFGTIDPPNIQRAESKPDPEKERLQQQLSQRDQRDAQNFQNDVINTGNTAIKRAIEVRLPKDLSDYHKEIIARLAFEEISDLLAKDQSYVASQRPLWQGALRSKFVGDWKARIVSAALARAKQSLNSVVNKHITKFTGKAPAKDGNKNKQVQQRGNGQGRSGSAGPSGQQQNYRAKQIDVTKTSALDILNDKVTLKS